MVTQMQPQPHQRLADVVLLVVEAMVRLVVAAVGLLPKKRKQKPSGSRCIAVPLASVSETHSHKL
jgi:hypothetical protein